MTIADRNIKLKHFITCLKCELSGKCCDNDCSTQYDAGNMGEIVENLEAISKVLENAPKRGQWKVVVEYKDNWISECSECKDTVWMNEYAENEWNFCPNCGADMRGDEE